MSLTSTARDVLQNLMPTDELLTQCKVAGVAAPNIGTLRERITWLRTNPQSAAPK